VSCENEARVGELEKRVKALKSAVDALLTIAEKAAASVPEDPAAAAFLAFQRSADARMGRPVRR
jgi:hypothetical protein